MAGGAWCGATNLNDESLRRCFLEVERAEHYKQALERVQQNGFVVFPRAAVGTGERLQLRCGVGAGEGA